MIGSRQLAVGEPEVLEWYFRLPTAYSQLPSERSDEPCAE
jgi:hypothetical protein